MPGSRWLVLTQYYAPEVGAPQVRLRAMAAELRRHGIDVTVLTAMPNYPTGRIAPGYQGRWRCQERIDGVLVTRAWIYAAAGRSTIKRLANYLSFTVSGFAMALFGPRPDVIFVETQPLTLGVAALLLKWCRNIPYIYNVPDLQIEVARELGFVRGRWVLSLAASVERFVARRSWKVATVTKQFVEHFVDHGVPRRQVTFLPNGADAAALRPLPSSAAIRERWNLAGKTVYLYVGTHSYYHGLEVVIDAAARLRARSDIAILMIGQGSERAALIDRAAALGLTNVVFADSPLDERAELYSIAHASLVTLRDIPVARRMRSAKIFPSLSCGVPVICAAVGEGGALVSQHECGVVVPPGDPVALADAMLALAADHRRRAEMARAGRALVEREYSWSVIVDRWLVELSGDAPLPFRSIAPDPAHHPKELQ
jgi:glycosyltransferase involved in cell wall biosynthesis